MIMANDDNIVRIVPTFPSEDFNNIYELKGHKNEIIEIKDYFNMFNKLLTVDKNGIILCWHIVDNDDNDSISNTEEEKSNINQK